MKKPMLRCFVVLLMTATCFPFGESHGDQKRASKRTGFKIATFSADVTSPVGHPLLGGFRDPAKEIVDPLFARGMVLLGSGEPIVLCAVDWCEIRNRSYDRWRETLAKAAGTQRQRVLVFSLHQHDAPVTDEGAAELLAKTDLAGEMFDVNFERDCIERTAKALNDSLKQARRVTHIGIGQAKVEKIASNRRIIRNDGTVTYGRGSYTGGNKYYRDAPDGLIDPWLKTISFWDGEIPAAALHTFATHPMSYYGEGGVSADFVGLARRFMQKDHPSVFQIYASGCSGDVTAGKYNDGSPANRPVLADRLYQAMKQAWKATKKHPLTKVDFRSTELDLEFRPDESHTADVLEKIIAKNSETLRNRILAAMGLASRQRVASGQKIDFPCIDFGSAQVVLFPGEAWVDYQLMAQQQRPDSTVVSIGYGECWPGYIPTTQGFDDNFDDSWYWVAPGSDKRMAAALNQVLPAAKKEPQQKVD